MKDKIYIFISKFNIKSNQKSKIKQIYIKNAVSLVPETWFKIVLITADSPSLLFQGFKAKQNKGN